MQAFKNMLQSKCDDIKFLVCNNLDDGPCESSPCKHGGTCGRQGLTQNYTCNCVSGYTGRLCETGERVHMLNSNGMHFFEIHLKCMLCQINKLKIGHMVCLVGLGGGVWGVLFYWFFFCLFFFASKISMRAQYPMSQS